MNYNILNIILMVNVLHNAFNEETMNGFVII